MSKSQRLASAVKVLEQISSRLLLAFTQLVVLMCEPSKSCTKQLAAD
jgi:hypothetical protein